MEQGEEPSISTYINKDLREKFYKQTVGKLTREDLERLDFDQLIDLANYVWNTYGEDKPSEKPYFSLITEYLDDVYCLTFSELQGMLAEAGK